MSKENNNFIRTLSAGFASHPWLKLISLILAVLVWFYASGAINKYY